MDRINSSTNRQRRVKSQLNEDSTDVEIFNIYADICAMFMQPHFDNSNYDYGKVKSINLTLWSSHLLKS